MLQDACSQAWTVECAPSRAKTVTFYTKPAVQTSNGMRNQARCRLK